MKTRIISSVETGLELVFHEDIIVTGNIEENAKVMVNGNLIVNGIIKQGAEVAASHSVTAQTVIGPNTIIRGYQIAIGAQIGEVSLDCHAEKIGICMSRESAKLLYGSYANTLFGNSSTTASTEQNISATLNDKKFSNK